MTDPYREGTPPSGHLDCPRCGKSLPPMDIATCPAECGTWVNATVASIAFQPDEIAVNHITRWWRVREPCPICKEQMLLRGSEDHEMFQGCTKHGYWIDVDTVSKTSLSRPGLLARLRKMREDEEAQKAALAAHLADKRAEAVRVAKEREEKRLEALREAEQEAKRKQQEKQREQEEQQRAATEKQRKKEEEKREKEEEKRAKAEAKPAAQEREVTRLEERRATLTASVKRAVEANDPGPIVDELLRLEGLLDVMTKRFDKLAQHFVFEDEEE